MQGVQINIENQDTNQNETETKQNIILQKLEQIENNFENFSTDQKILNREIFTFKSTLN